MRNSEVRLQGGVMPCSLRGVDRECACARHTHNASIARCEERGPVALVSCDRPPGLDRAPSSLLGIREARVAILGTSTKPNGESTRQAFLSIGELLTCCSEKRRILDRGLPDASRASVR